MRFFACLFLVCILYSCGERNQPENDKIEIESKQSNENVNTDTHFVLLDIKNLNFIDSLNWDFGNLYLDKSKNQKFEKLTSDQKAKLVSPFLKNQNGTSMDADWVKNDLQAFIVAKQSIISNFQPTIIKVYGTDLAAVLLVNLQNDNKVISGFPIYNIENSGPEIAEDSIIITRPKINCNFKNNVIQLYKLTGTCYPNSGEPYLFTIDSITSQITINNSGEVETKTLDSIRYKKISKLEYFQSN